jgi:hypothetical protein
MLSSTKEFIMETIQLTDSLKEILEFAQGRSLEEKIYNLMFSDLEGRLQKCSERILEFEKKYGSDFSEFDRAWQEDKIPNKLSREAEKDYMEWESLEDEHTSLLSQISTLKRESSSIR